MWSGGGVLLLESLDDLCPETIIVVLEVFVPRTVPSISTRGGIKKNLECWEWASCLWDRLSTLLHFQLKLHESRKASLYSQSVAMPTVTHFRKRHSWHWLRVFLSMAQFWLYLHWYCKFFWMVLRKNPWDKKGNIQLLLAHDSPGRGSRHRCAKPLTWTECDYQEG